MKERKEIKIFEDIKDKVTLNALSKISLERPLIEKEFNDYQNAFFRYYNIPNILKQNHLQIKEGKK